MKSITKAARTLLLFIYLREFGMGLYTLQMLRVYVLLRDER